MADQALLQKLFVSKGFSDYCWIAPHEIVTTQWVRMKYMFGCDSYGSASCPTDIPSPEHCRIFFDEYRLGTLFHISQSFNDPEERHIWSREVKRALLDLERSICSSGYHKAFLLFMDSCNLCRECAGTRASCRNKKMARPHPQGLGVDLFATVSKYGYSLDVSEDNERQLDSYAILLIE
jgi:predicted metal-binding protein